MFICNSNDVEENMNSLYPVICVESVEPLKQFYTSLLNFNIVFELDWYIQLQSPTDENLQLAFVQRSHQSVPKRFQQTPKGVIVTVEVDDVDTLYQKALDMQFDIALELKDEDWGQHHFMTVDPEGLLVDVVKMIPPSGEFLAAYEGPE